MNMDEFWKSLGLNPKSSPEQIKKQYRALARVYHPDNKDTGNAEEFKKVHHAYKMLTDPSYSYDNAPKKQPISIQTIITLEQAVFGCTIYHDLTKINPLVENKVKHEIFEIVDKIPKGTLHFPFSKVLKEVVFSDSVNHSIVITYLLSEDPYYKVNNGKIIVNLELEPMQALKGAKIQVKTLFGLRNLRIPPGTVPEDTFLIKNHGFLPPLIVRISNIKYPRKAQLQTDPAYASLNINWAAEEEVERKELEDFEKTFNNLK